MTTDAGIRFMLEVERQFKTPRKEDLRDDQPTEAELKPWYERTGFLNRILRRTCPAQPCEGA